MKRTGNCATTAPMWPRWTRAVEQLRHLVADSTDIPAAQKQAFNAVIDAYQRSFTAYVAASAKADQVTKAMVASGRDHHAPFRKDPAILPDPARHRAAPGGSGVAGQPSGARHYRPFRRVVDHPGHHRAADPPWGRIRAGVASGDLTAQADGTFTGEFAELRGRYHPHGAKPARQHGPGRGKTGRRPNAKARAAEEAMHATMAKEAELWPATLGPHAPSGRERGGHFPPAVRGGPGTLLPDRPGRRRRGTAKTSGGRNGHGHQPDERHGARNRAQRRRGRRHCRQYPGKRPDRSDGRAKGRGFHGQGRRHCHGPQGRHGQPRPGSPVHRPGGGRDQRHRRPDQPAGLKCRHRGGQSRRGRTRLRRGGRRSPKARRKNHGRDQRGGKSHPGHPGRGRPQ